MDNLVSVYPAWPKTQHFLSETRSAKIRRTYLVEKWCDFRYIFDELKTESLVSYIDKLQFLHQNISRANNRDGGWIVELEAIQCYFVGLRQNWLCALTGDPLEFVRGGTNWNGKWCNPKSCTIDRIDPNRHYFEDNVQLVTWEANYVKNSLTMEELIQFSKKVLNKHG